MKSSVILASALATMAMASPAIKRDIMTEVVYEVVTVTETGTGPSPTAAPATTEPTTEATTETTTETADPTVDAGAFFSAAADAVPAVQSAAAPSADYSSLSDYAAPILKAHNQARAQHSVGDLEWDDSLAAIAEAIGQTCIYDHNTQMGGGGYGQNIAAGASPSDINTVIFNDMYESEIVHYNAYGSEPDMGSLGDWGHATQIIWKGTTKVGCATVSCGLLQNAGGMAPEFTVCNYSPAGNMVGAFAENVLPN